MKLSDLLERLEAIRGAIGQDGDTSLVIAYRDKPDDHYAFDDLLTVTTSRDAGDQMQIVLLAG